MPCTPNGLNSSFLEGVGGAARGSSWETALLLLKCSLHLKCYVLLMKGISY